MQIKLDLGIFLLFCNNILPNLKKFFVENYISLFEVLNACCEEYLLSSNR